MISAIKNELSNNSDKIQEILEDLECYNIKLLNNQFRFGLDDTGSSTSNSLMVETLYYKSFSKDISGDIITMVSFIKDISTGEAIKWLAKKLNIKQTYEKETQVNLPWGGFWREISKYRDNSQEEVVVYDNSILNDYLEGANTKFIKDGISAQTQEYYKLGYDLETNRITIPWFNSNNELVGIMGRANWNVNDGESKYLPVIKFSKSMHVYSFNESYNEIKNKNMCLIGESEKFSMQLHSMGIGIGLSVGGNTINEARASIIKSLFVSTYILVFDEGLDEEYIQKQAEKLKVNNPLIKNTVGYIYDKYNKYIPLGSKLNAVDLGKETLKMMLAECVVWL